MTAWNQNDINMTCSSNQPSLLTRALNFAGWLVTLPILWWLELENRKFEQLWQERMLCDRMMKESGSRPALAGDGPAERLRAASEYKAIAHLKRCWAAQCLSAEERED